MWLPFDISRLVLDYLAQRGCQETYNHFLHECSDFEKYRDAFARDPQTRRVNGWLPLETILHEYSLMKEHELKYANSNFNNIHDRIVKQGWQEFEQAFMKIRSCQMSLIMERTSRESSSHQQQQQQMHLPPGINSSRPPNYNMASRAQRRNLFPEMHSSQVQGIDIPHDQLRPVRTQQRQSGNGNYHVIIQQQPGSQQPQQMFVVPQSQHAQQQAQHTQQQSQHTQLQKQHTQQQPLHTQQHTQQQSQQQQKQAQPQQQELASASSSASRRQKRQPKKLDADEIKTSNPILDQCSSTKRIDAMNKVISKCGAQVISVLKQHKKDTDNVATNPPDENSIGNLLLPDSLIDMQATDGKSSINDIVENTLKKVEGEETSQGEAAMERQIRSLLSLESECDASGIAVSTASTSYHTYAQSTTTGATAQNVGDGGTSERKDSDDKQSENCQQDDDALVIVEPHEPSENTMAVNNLLNIHQQAIQQQQQQVELSGQTQLQQNSPPRTKQQSNDDYQQPPRPPIVTVAKTSPLKSPSKKRKPITMLVQEPTTTTTPVVRTRMSARQKAKQQQQDRKNDGEPPPKKKRQRSGSGNGNKKITTNSRKSSSDTASSAADGHSFSKREADVVINPSQPLVNPVMSMEVTLDKKQHNLQDVIGALTAQISQNGAALSQQQTGGASGLTNAANGSSLRDWLDSSNNSNRPLRTISPSALALCTTSINKDDDDNAPEAKRAEAGKKRNSGGWFDQANPTNSKMDGRKPLTSSAASSSRGDKQPTVSNVESNRRKAPPAQREKTPPRRRLSFAAAEQLPYDDVNTMNSQDSDLQPSNYKTSRSSCVSVSRRVPLTTVPCSPSKIGSSPLQTPMQTPLSPLTTSRGVSPLPIVGAKPNVVVRPAAMHKSDAAGRLRRVAARATAKASSEGSSKQEANNMKNKFLSPVAEEKQEREEASDKKEKRSVSKESSGVEKKQRKRKKSKKSKKSKDSEEAEDILQLLNVEKAVSLIRE